MGSERLAAGGHARRSSTLSSCPDQTGRGRNRPAGFTSLLPPPVGHGSALSQRFVELSWFEKGKNKQLMRGQIPNSVLFLLILQHCSFHISLMGSRPSAVFFFQLTLCWTSPDAQTQLCIFGLRNKSFVGGFFSDFGGRQRLLRTLRRVPHRLGL